MDSATPYNLWNGPAHAVYTNVAAMTQIGISPACSPDQGTSFTDHGNISKKIQEVIDKKSDELWDINQKVLPTPTRLRATETGNPAHPGRLTLPRYTATQNWATKNAELMAISRPCSDTLVSP